MADRYWVLGTGNTNDTARWSATSGGAGGETVPTSADNAYFDGNSDKQASKSVTSITLVGTTATATSTAHGYANGNTVTIAGAVETEYNGTYTISNVATDTFDYTIVGTPASPATGTITVARRAAFTVTVNATFSCKDFIVGDGVTPTVLSQAMTLAGSSAWNIHGSLFFPVTNFTRSYTGAVTFAATTTGNVITLNGKSLTSSTVTFNGASGEWTLGSAATFTSSDNAVISLLRGSLITNNYNVTIPSFYFNGSLVRSITLGSSTVSISGNIFVVVDISGTNLTFNAGTSKIILTSLGASNLFAFNAPITLYDVEINGTPSYVVQGSITYNNVQVNGALPGFTGSNTFNNLTIAASGSTGIRTLNFPSNQTINGTLTLQSATTDPTRRINVSSSTFGTARTLTCAAISIGEGVDFRDITIAGAAAPFDASTKTTGNLGNNSGITFPAAKTV
jgi:hypothetical protein